MSGERAGGPVAAGRHAGGLRRGLRRFVHPDGPLEEGRYLAGRLHGERVLRGPSGATVVRECWRRGRIAEAGRGDCE